MSTLRWQKVFRHIGGADGMAERTRHTENSHCCSWNVCGVVFSGTDVGKTALVVVVRHPSSSSPPPPPSSSSSSSSSPSSSSWPVARRRRRRPLLPHVVERDLVLNEFLVCCSPATLPRVGRRVLRATAPLRPRPVLPLDRLSKVIREISPQIAIMANLPHGRHHGSGASVARSRFYVKTTNA